MIAEIDQPVIVSEGIFKGKQEVEVELALK
jgi:hypothetical protein